MDPADAPSPSAAPRSEDPAPADPATGAHPHNFAVQKEEHRRIRNDPDYDDWEYGTEPLPQEAWLPGTRPPASASGDAAAG